MSLEEKTLYESLSKWSCPPYRKKAYLPLYTNTLSVEPDFGSAEDARVLIVIMFRTREHTLFSKQSESE